MYKVPAIGCASINFAGLRQEVGARVSLSVFILISSVQEQSTVEWPTMISDSLVSDAAVLSGCVDEAQLESGPPISAHTQHLKYTSARSSDAHSVDECLVAKVLGGSKEALGLLFRRHRRSVLSVAGRILRDASEAEDLCQEVFLLVFQKANLFDPTKGTASSWIVQIAYSRALNRRRYLTVRQHYDAHELNEERIEGARRPLFIDAILARSLLGGLRDQLSDEQRNTLELHFFEGYSLREIAEKTGQAIGTVRHHYYRGLERLRSNVFPQKDS